MIYTFKSLDINAIKFISNYLFEKTGKHEGVPLRNTYMYFYSITTRASNSLVVEAKFKSYIPIETETFFIDDVQVDLCQDLLTYEIFGDEEMMNLHSTAYEYFSDDELKLSILTGE